MTAPIDNATIGGAAAGGRKREVLAGYARSAGWVAAALLLALWAAPVLDPTTLFLAAVLVAAWSDGLGPGLLAAVVALVAVEYYFTPPFHSLEPRIQQLPRLLAFAVLAVLSAWGSAARKKADMSLRQARDELDARVLQRTAELTAANRQLAMQAGRLIHAQEDERSRIGRELHDHISQALGLLTIKIDQLRADAAVPPQLAASLEALRQDTAELAGDVHRLSHRLHSSMLDYLGLVPALQKLVAEFSQRHQIAIDFVHTALPAPLRSDVALCLFRVAEESLANIMKHSRARTARLMVAGADDGIHLTVEDAGTGFDMKTLANRTGLGFVSMQERLRVVGGAVRVDSAPSRGTRIEVWVPAASLLAGTESDDAVEEPAARIAET
jgi:signal transduction histidine kinase